MYIDLAPIQTLFYGAVSIYVVYFVIGCINAVRSDSARQRTAEKYAKEKKAADALKEAKNTLEVLNTEAYPDPAEVKQANEDYRRMIAALPAPKPAAAKKPWEDARYAVGSFAADGSLGSYEDSLRPRFIKILADLRETIISLRIQATRFSFFARTFGNAYPALLTDIADCEQWYRRLQDCLGIKRKFNRLWEERISPAAVETAMMTVDTPSPDSLSEEQIRDVMARLKDAEAILVGARSRTSGDDYNRLSRQIFAMKTNFMAYRDYLDKAVTAAAGRPSAG